MARHEPHNVLSGGSSDYEVVNVWSESESLVQNNAKVSVGKRPIPKAHR